MRSSFQVWVKTVDYGKNENWLKLETYVSRFDANRKYIIDYCGTELITDIPLTDSEYEELRNQFVEDFDYPPFNIEQIKNIIGESKGYLVLERQ